MASKKLRFVVLLMVLLVLTCTLVACVRPQTTQSYKVIIHPNNGDTNVIMWDRTQDFPTLSYSDHVFVGLYLDAEFTTATTQEELKAMWLTEDIDVYVKWTTYQATIHPQNGGNDVVWRVGDALPALTNPGYVVDGFYIDADLTTAIKLGEVAVLTENIEVWVKWSECDHKAIENWTDDTEPNCTDKGHRHATCPTCLKEVEEDIPALGHNLTHHEAVPATCSSAGNVEYWSCDVCKCNFSDAEGTKEIEDVTVAINPDNHSFGDWVNEVAATCTKDGVKGHKDCTLCHKHFDIDGNEITDLTIDQLGHNYEGAKVTYVWNDDHTVCTAKHTCTRTGCENEESATATITTKVTPATCTTAETTVYTATFSENWVTTQTTDAIKTGDALDHAWGTVDYVWADDNSTCTATRTCTREGCTHEETETVNSKADVTQEYNCVTNELTKYTATFTNSAFETQVKENVVTKQAQAGQHNYSVFVNYVEGHVPTCTEGGKAVYQCSGCDETETRDVDALGHEYTNYVSNNDAKCGVDGTKTATCDHNCGTKDTITDTGSALKHEFTNYVYNNDAKCGVNGTETATCDHGCGQTDTRTKEGTALEHKYTNYVSNNDAKCGVDGTKTAKCDHGCGTTDTITDEGTALEHKYTNYTYNNDAKCGVNGTETATCDHGCGQTDTRTKEGTALEHKYTNYVSNNDATCTEDGTKTATCDHGCGTKDTITDVDSKLGHTLKLVDAKEPTCVAAGNIAHYHCETCGKNFSDAEGTIEITTSVIIEEKGHDYGAWISNGDGTHTKTCKNDPNHTVTEDCSGGTATCQEKATCKDCGEKYGDLAAHTYTYVEEIPAIGSNNGTKAHCTCSTCDKLFDTTDAHNEVTKESLIMAVTQDAYTSTIVIADYAEFEANNWTNTNNYFSVGNSIFTVTIDDSDKNNYNNTGKYYSSNETWRIYQTEGATFTIAANGDYKITSVTIVYKNGNSGILTYKTTQIKSDDRIQLIDDSIVLGVAQSTATDKANGNIQITSIIVGYNYTTDQAKADAAASELNLEGLRTEFDAEKQTLTLPTADSAGAKLNGADTTWTVEDNKYCTIKDNVLTINSKPTAEEGKQTFTLTANVKVDDATNTTKTLTISIIAEELKYSVTLDENIPDYIKVTVTNGSEVVAGTMVTITVENTQSDDYDIVKIVATPSVGDAKTLGTAAGTYTFDIAADTTITVETKSLKGTSIDKAYTVEELWAAYGDLANKAYSDEKVYVKGVVVTAPEYSETWESYTFYIKSSATGEKQVQGYSVKFGTDVEAVYQNDEIVMYGFVEMYNNTLEITFKTSGDNAEVVERTAGTSTITYECSDETNATVTLDKNSSTNGEKFNNGEKVTLTVSNVTAKYTVSVTLNGTAVTLGDDGTYTATIVGDMKFVVTVSAPVVPGTTKTVTVDLTENFSTGYGDEAWVSNYSEHTVSGSGLGVDAYVTSVVFTNASKLTESSSNKITDMPVVASKSSNPQYVTINVTGYTIQSAQFSLKEWTNSKEFRTVTIEYSTDGITWTAAKNVGQVDANAAAISVICPEGTLKADSLPASVIAVRLVVLSSGGSNTQVGIAGFELVLTAASSGETGGNTGTGGDEGGESGTETGLTDQEKLNMITVQDTATGNFDVTTDVDGSQVTWTSSNENVIKVENGVANVTQQDETVEVTLTATIGETSKDFKVSVTGTKTTGGGETTKDVTIDFTAKGYSNGNEVTSIKQDGCTVTFALGTNSNGNTPKYYNSGTAVRCYVGNTVTIEGNSIKELVIECPSDNYVDTWVTSLTNAGYTASQSGSTVIVTFNGALQEITITCSANTRIKGMTITVAA